MKSETAIAEVKRSLMSELTELFQGGEAYSISRLILEHFGYPEHEILKNPDASVSHKILVEIKKIVTELNKNKPIQYILGYTFFYDLKFMVNERVLIPRPETEELVSAILLENTMEAPFILDIGTGSGCIAISLSKNIVNSKVTAIDIDSEALKTAEANAKLNKAKVDFIEMDLLSEKSDKMETSYDLIVSNPPYVKEEEKIFMLPNVLNYEPAKALYVPDDDPLLFYRHIIQLAEDKLARKGTIWVEINQALGQESLALFRDSGYRGTRLLKDIYGRDRFIKAWKDE